MGKSLYSEQAMPRVLVVDDDPEVAKSIENSLRRLFHVTVVNSGIAALKSARNHPPSLMVLDVVMPGMDGFETCKEFRADPVLADIPILFLTALGRDEDRIEGLRAGADDYLTKPFNLEELQLRIHAILRRITPKNIQPADNFVKLNQLMLDRQNYTAHSPKGESLLTPIEFELLYHLMTHSNEVFTSDKLLQEVWDYPADTGSPDLVRMHIKNLRNKIETDPRNPQVIITIPRRGYTIAGK